MAGSDQPFLLQSGGSSPSPSPGRLPGLALVAGGQSARLLVQLSKKPWMIRLKSSLEAFSSQLSRRFTSLLLRRSLASMAPSLRCKDCWLVQLEQPGFVAPEASAVKALKAPTASGPFPGCSWYRHLVKAGEEAKASWLRLPWLQRGGLMSSARICFARWRTS
eukprot:symbB.v1.2.017671.t1/scaffold1380.1/size122483/9